MINFIKKFFNSRSISSKGICSICGNLFDDDKLETVETLALCKNDIHLFRSFQWVLILESQSDPENPQAALYTQNIKDLLNKNKIKSYIVVSYNSKDDVIFSNFKLFIPKQKIQAYHQLKLPKHPL